MKSVSTRAIYTYMEPAVISSLPNEAFPDPPAPGALSIVVCT